MLLRRQLRNFYGSGWFHHNVAVAVFTVLSDAITPHASERTVPALQSTIYISDSGDDKNDGLSLKTAIYSLKRAKELHDGRDDCSWHFGPRAWKRIEKELSEKGYRPDVV